MTVTGMVSSTSAALRWSAERRRWTAFYERHLQDRLDWAIEYVRAHPPFHWAAHLDTFLTLLRQARRWPALHRAVTELISALHPWPSRWGHWQRWEDELRFALRVCAALGQRERQVEFLEHLAELLHHTGRWEEALATGRQAMALARECRQPLSLVRAGGSVAATLRFAGRREEAQQLLRDLEADPWVRAATGPTQTFVRAQTLLNYVDSFRDEGRVEEAIGKFDEMIGMLEALPEPDMRLLALSHRARGLLSWLCGAYSEAIRSLRRAMELLAQMGDVFTEAITSGILGLVYWSMGALDAAEAAIRHSIEVNERLGAYWRLVPEVGNLGLVYLSRGQLCQALVHIERQITLARHIGAASELYRGLGNRATVKVLLGEYAAAEPDLRQEGESIAQSGRRQSVGCYYVHLSRCRAGLGRLDEARQLAEQALELARQIPSVDLEVMARRCLAEYEPPQEKAVLLRQALELARGRRKLDEAGCLLSLAGLAEDEKERNRLWEEGVHLLEEMGATAWLEGHSPDHPPLLALLL